MPYNAYMIIAVAMAPIVKMLLRKNNEKRNQSGL